MNPPTVLRSTTSAISIGTSLTYQLLSIETDFVACCIYAVDFRCDVNKVIA